VPRKTAVDRRLAEYRRKRDFTKTREPAGARSAKRADTLHFVIQKHAASHLHFDLRLELDGVMKSWAVPKGPSLDPSVKRLAMQVEDHPIEYNTFEGTIPKGEYGGGTVMLWDRGTYTADEPVDGSDAEAIRRGFAKGKLDVTFHGERLHGSFALVRTRRGEENGKAQWLLIKHRDDFARPGSDVVADEMTSVDTGRTMDEIAEAKRGRVWRSNRDDADTARTRKASSASSSRSRKSTSRRAGSRRGSSGSGAADPAAFAAQAGLAPMLCAVGDALPSNDGWTFEPKYDGVRVLAYATRDGASLVTRNGKDKSEQFPEIVDTLRTLARQARKPAVLDGEIVALVDGAPARFQQLQDRVHVKDESAIAERSSEAPAALIVFDLLMKGDDVLLQEPWTVRRGQLEKLLRNRTSPSLRLGESIPNGGEEMLARAAEHGWEGIIAKRMEAPYRPGARSPDWLKLKLESRQEFVVGGYTEPRNTRAHIGALLLGYFDHGRFIYVGHTGGGFTRDGLEAMHRRLAPLERTTSPFVETPKTNEKAHWVEPRVVVEVKFNEWTDDGKLRQPIYLGTRDDKNADDVGREPKSLQRRETEAGRREPASVRRSRANAGASARTRRTRTSASRLPPHASLLSHLESIEKNGGSGAVELPTGTLDVTNLDKVFFPKEKLTKGDLMRYYARMADAVLPVVEDRPLVLKRYPNGITGQSFYQQKASEDVPAGVRVEVVTNEQGEEQRRIIGGDLLTLLYTIQLGAISFDPWHSRVQTCDDADYTILDLDPGPRARFARVVDVARFVKEELDALGLRAVPKTSGSTGIHIVVPLPPKISNEAALLLAQLIATRVAEKHPREATIERSVKARPPAAVYVDYLQNIRGKTVAGAYAVRAREGATVSTPLEWKELDESLDPRAFTIETVPERVARVGDLWGQAMKRRNTAKAIREAADV
jgi:bifunctional non-homologous end joining protein LigD